MTAAATPNYIALAIEHGGRAGSLRAFVRSNADHADNLSSLSRLAAHESNLARSFLLMGIRQGVQR